jgi:hypothetical protein
MLDSFVLGKSRFQFIMQIIKPYNFRAMCYPNGDLARTPEFIGKEMELVI